jgi:serine/threonine protein phosphatase PrpC/LysM repeat protein
MQTSSFSFGNGSDVGLKRQENEDYLAAFQSPNGAVFIVCDGMGGHVGGATAARLATDALMESLREHIFGSAPEALQKAIAQANAVVLAEAQKKPQLQGMGTTVVILLLQGHQAYYAHIGDSRLYHYHTQTGLRTLTKDHSHIQNLIDQGLLTAAEASTHPQRHQLSKALGTQESVEATISAYPLALEAGDFLVLCSDGLTEHVSELQISNVLKGASSPQEKADILIRLAKEGGGSDNITVQVVQMAAAPSQATTYTKQSSLGKKLSPWLFPALLLAALLLFFGLQYFYESGINKEKSRVLQDSLQRMQEQKRYADSLLAVDNKADTFIVHRLKKGESLFLIGKKYSLPVDSLLEWNALENLSKIEVGRPIKIKVKMVYTLEKDQSLEELYAERFARWEKSGITLEALRKANSSKDDALEGILPKGRQIIVPERQLIYY